MPGSRCVLRLGAAGYDKTYTLGKLIAEAALAGKRIVATSIANVAVDQLAIQVMRALEGVGAAGESLLTSGQVIRFGHPRLPEVVKEAKLFPHQRGDSSAKATATRRPGEPSKNS